MIDGIGEACKADSTWASENFVCGADLNLVVQKGYDFAKVEMDSKVLFDRIKGNKNRVSWYLQYVVEDIDHLKNLLQDCKFSLVRS